MGKTKTPMCLVNELCRHNNIQHQYHLVEESGPPHGKTFTVVLKLGDQEEYKATGSSIRKAQHAAAEKALLESKLPQPSPKTPKRSSRTNMPLTPTVELNVLAMKRGEPAIYQVYEPPRPIPAALSHFGPPAAPAIYDFRGMYNQRYHYPRGLYCATVSVGDKQFMGKGKTAQAARHAAAEEALKMIRELPLPDHRQTKDPVAEDNSIKSPISLVHEMSLKRNLTVKFDVVSESGPSHMPSFITRCIVGEIVTESEGNGKKLSKRRAAEKMLEELKKLPPLPPSEETVEADAKAMKKKNFTKKKKNSNLIKDKLRNEKCGDAGCNQSESLNGENSPVEANGTKALETNESNATVHPISRLIQLQQAKKEREPQFRVIAERTLEKRRKEFVIECTITNTKSFMNINGNTSNVISATGTGSNKKIAKKEAAEAMLHLLGYSSKDEQLSINTNNGNHASPPSILKTQAQNGKDQPIIANGSESATEQGPKVRKVKFVESRPVVELNEHHHLIQQGQPHQMTYQSQTTQLQQPQPLRIKPGVVSKTPINKLGRQLVPGLLLMPAVENSLENTLLNSVAADSTAVEEEKYQQKLSGVSLNECDALEAAAVIAKELLDTGMSTSALALLKQKNANGSTIDALPTRITRPSLQLQYLSSILGSSFQIHFSDFPKNNKMEYLTVITITTNPPRVSHGLGATVDASRDAAALQALKSLESTLSNRSVSGC